jgi:hypothetical protein
MVKCMQKRKRRPQGIRKSGYKLGGGIIFLFGGGGGSDKKQTPENITYHR